MNEITIKPSDVKASTFDELEVGEIFYQLVSGISIVYMKVYMKTSGQDCDMNVVQLRGPESGTLSSLDAKTTILIIENQPCNDPS